MFVHIIFDFVLCCFCDYFLIIFFHKFLVNFLVINVFPWFVLWLLFLFFMVMFFFIFYVGVVIGLFSKILVNLFLFI